MTRVRTKLGAITVMLAIAMAGAIVVSHKIHNIEDKETTEDDLLYLQSSKNVKRFSLGYSALLADIYWTRGVQYFGAKHLDRSNSFELLYPLLNMATDLDPELIVVYQNGAIFLSAAPPGGAGQPDKAVDLLKKGIRDNPAFWRLYFTLGFIQYMDRHDYKAAQEAFERGSQVPGALPWMKVMAARMAQHAGERSTAVAIWSQLLESTQDPGIRQNAREHLTALRVDIEVNYLENLVDMYREKTGNLPASWNDLTRLRMLVGIPLDPSGKRYTLTSDGRVLVADPRVFPYITQGLPIGTK